MPSTLPKMANINRLNRHCFYLNTAYFIVGEKPTGFTSILYDLIRHYLLGKWINSKKTGQTAGRSGNSDATKFSLV